MGTQNSYGIMYSADVATYGSWRGSSLLLTETAGQRDLAYPFSNGNPLGPQGRSMDVPDPYRGTTWTLEQASGSTPRPRSTTARAASPATARTGFVNSLYRTTSKRPLAGAPYAYVLPAGQRDPYAVYEMLHTMELGKVEIDRATAPFTAGGKSYAAGSYILRTQQPLGRWVNQLLDDATYPNWAKPCSSCPLTMPYSEFTDRIPLLFGFTADPVQAAFTAATERVTKVKPESVLLPQPPPSTGAYLVPPGSYGIAKLLGNLQNWDVPTFRAGAAFSARRARLRRGHGDRAADGAGRMVLDEVQKAAGLAVHAVDQTPDVAGFELRPGTRIGLVRGANNMPGGWLMWTLEHFDMEYEVVSADDYDKLDALYDTIILAPGISRARIVDGLDPSRYPAEFSWARGVGETGWSQLAAFVRGGGTLLGLGSASETAQQLLNLPISRVATVQPFRSAARCCARVRHHAARGLGPALGLGDVLQQRPRVQRVGQRQGRRRLPGHGQHARVRLRGRRRAAARQGRRRLDGRRRGLGHGRRLAVDVPLVAALAVAAGLQLRLPRAVEGGHGAGAEGRRGRRLGAENPGAEVPVPPRRRSPTPDVKAEVGDRWPATRRRGRSRPPRR